MIRCGLLLEQNTLACVVRLNRDYHFFCFYSLKRGSHPTQHNQRNQRKLQPIRTELSSFLLNSSFKGFRIKKKSIVEILVRFSKTCCATFDANQIEFK